MPKAGKTRSQKKSSAKISPKSRRTVSKSRMENVKKKSQPKNGKGVPDTFEAWIEKQARSPSRPSEAKSREDVKMPSDSMSEWLSRQTVAEKSSSSELKLPIGTTELWLQKQVTLRLANKQDEEETRVEEKEATIASSSSGTVQIYSETTETNGESSSGESPTSD